MAASHSYFHFRHRPLSSELSLRRISLFSLSSVSPYTSKIRAYAWSSRRGRISPSPVLVSRCAADSQLEGLTVEVQQGQTDRPPFDLNLAVILAGFAFEAYYTPPEDIGKHEIDAAGCKSVFLSESFLREIYDGQLFLKLKKGLNLPAMDPWGTSDPYVVMQYGGQVVKSKIKWGKKEPTWNEEFTLNIKLPPEDLLQVAAWDANLVTPHKRMGNSGVSLEGICDGDLHELLVELEGIGGGGKVQLEVRYRSIDEIDKDKSWWKVPYLISDFLRKNGFESALQMLVGSETMQTREFVQYAFGQLKSLNDTYALKDKLPSILRAAPEDDKRSNNPSLKLGESSKPENSSEGYQDKMNCIDVESTEECQGDSTPVSDNSTSVAALAGEAMKSGDQFWKSFSDAINHNVFRKFGVAIPENMRWDGVDLLNKIGLQLGKDAEASYVESGLATPRNEDINNCEVAESESNSTGGNQSSLPEVKKAAEILLRQTDSIFGALMVLAASVPRLKMESDDVVNEDGNGRPTEEGSGNVSGVLERIPLGELDERREQEMKSLFSTAESAMEAWTMLATSLGHPSFIKSEFEKICFLDNPSTDTQVAIWRDLMRKRLVVAFRGTEQTKWKDLMTDLMLAPAGLNPERIGGDFKQEVQVHSGFLSAYDSVRTIIMSLIRKAVGYMDNGPEKQVRWQVYVTGHSLGGALATLLALELSSSPLSKFGAIHVTMYNFGSPRVGNRRFAEVYNEKVKDSWRVVNHRDIIPTVPRLMGYCHVAQPVYLAPGDFKNVIGNLELLGDDYQGDVIGESTPDVIVSEFLKGERELIEKLLQTEISIFRSIRDGSALMQHMEDFYYITLLENVRSRYQTSSLPQTQEDCMSVFECSFDC